MFKGVSMACPPLYRREIGSVPSSFSLRACRACCACGRGEAVRAHDDWTIGVLMHGPPAFRFVLLDLISFKVFLCVRARFVLLFIVVFETSFFVVRQYSIWWT